MTSVNKYLYDGETVCIGRKGTINNPFFYKGKLWTVDTLFYTHSFNMVLPKFVFYLAENINWLKYNEASGVPSLSKRTIEKINVIIPAINEQKKINSFLTSIDERIQVSNKIIDNLELLKKGLLQKVFSQKIRFKNEKNKMFSEWKKKSLGQICKIVKGEQLNREELTETGTYPCQNGGVLPSGFTENFNTNENTITISEGGNSCGHINYQKTKFWSGGHCYSLLELENEIDVIFLFQYLKFNENKIKRLRVGSGLPNIQRKDIILFKVYLPSIEEQTKIANFLSSIDTKIDVEVQLLQKLKEQKKYLLQQLFC